MQSLYMIPLILCLISGVFLYLSKFKKMVNDLTMISISGICLILNLILLFMPNGMKLNLFSITKDLVFMFKIDFISKIFGLLISIIWLAVSIFSIKYMDKEENVNKFYSYSILTLSFMLGLSYSGNLLTMYLVYEFVTLASMPLVMHEKTKESKNAALKYLFYSLGGGFLGLFAVISGMIYSTNGGEFILGGSFDSNVANASLTFIQVSILLGLIGFGAKCGAFPLQSWLPTAHPVAPSPASALLSGIITKAGVIVIIRLIFFVFGTSIIKGSFVQYTWEVILLISILLGSTLALLQNTFKRRLAYSSISQLSYILLGLCALNEDGFSGALLHVMSHAFVKVGLFLVAGVLIYQYEIHKVDEMDGIGKKAPITMWCYTLFSLALIGIPPTGCFFSKWFLAEGSLNNGLVFFNYFGAIVLLISAILTACYLLPLSIKAFFPKNTEELKIEKEPVLMVISLICLVVGVFAIGIFSGYIVEFVSSMIGGVL